MTETLNHLTDKEWVTEIKRRRDLAIRALATATNPLRDVRSSLAATATKRS
jgi:predicted transcriptional regulator